MNIAIYLSPERLKSFQFTNPHDPAKLVVLYAQQLTATNYIDFKGVAGAISLSVYLVAAYTGWS